MPPSDALHDIRSEMMLTMIECGLKIEAQHHEVATGGQGEIDMKYAPLVEMADNVLKYKYIVKNVARKHGKTATFMPKPLFMDNGSGMHVHSSLWKDGKNLYAGSGYAGLSDMAMYAIGGLLRHAPALCAITNPTTNSYKRLVPGYEAPVNLAYSRRNRSASIRIPVYSPSPKAKRIEFRCPDGSSNPYLAFSAMLMAMLDGIKNKMKPGEPLDKDIYDLDPEELAKVPKTPGSLDEALEQPGEGPRIPAARRRLHQRRDLRRGSGTSAKRKSTRSACGRIRMSSRCILIFERFSVSRSRNHMGGHERETTS